MERTRRWMQMAALPVHYGPITFRRNCPARGIVRCECQTQGQGLGPCLGKQEPYLYFIISFLLPLSCLSFQRVPGSLSSTSLWPSVACHSPPLLLSALRMCEHSKQMDIGKRNEKGMWETYRQKYKRVGWLMDGRTYNFIAPWLFSTLFI